MTLHDMTLTEQKLCKMWLQASHTGDWWDLYQQLANIRDVLESISPVDDGGDVADMFADAAMMALTRCSYDIYSREAA